MCARSVAQLCLTLCHFMDYSPPDSSIHRIFQARIPEWVAISFQGIVLTQGLNPCLLHLLCWPGDSLTMWKGNANPLQYSCLKNHKDRGASRATVHRLANTTEPLKKQVYPFPITQQEPKPLTGSPLVPFISLRHFD